MKPINVDDFLITHPLSQLQELAAFGALNDQFLRHIVEYSEKLEAPRDSLLFEQDQYTDYFYTVITGQINLYKGENSDNHIINELHPGESVGFIGMLCMTYFHGDVIVTEPSILLKTSNELFASLPCVDGEQFSIFLMNLARNIGRAYVKTI